MQFIPPKMLQLLEQKKLTLQEEQIVMRQAEDARRAEIARKK